MLDFQEVVVGDCLKSVEESRFIHEESMICYIISIQLEDIEYTEKVSRQYFLRFTLRFGNVLTSVDVTSN